MGRNVIVTLLDGSQRRVDLDKLIQFGIRGGSDSYGVGVDLLGVWGQLCAGRIFVGTYSRWDNGRGECRGEAYHEADEYEVAGLAQRNSALMPYVPELHDA